MTLYNDECRTTIKRRRLKWLGPLMRLPGDTPTRRLSLKEHLRPDKNKKGRPKTTWLKTIIVDLVTDPKNRDETFIKLEEITHDRKEWDSIVQTLVQ